MSEKRQLEKGGTDNAPLQQGDAQTPSVLQQKAEIFVKPESKCGECGTTLGPSGGCSWCDRFGHI